MYETKYNVKIFLLFSITVKKLCERNINQESSKRTVPLKAVPTVMLIRQDGPTMDIINMAAEQWRGKTIFPLDFKSDAIFKLNWPPFVNQRL